MKIRRFKVYICVLSLMWVFQDIQAQTHQLQDAAGKIEIGDPRISEKPEAPSERWSAPLIMKQFRFEGSPAGVLISTWIRPDLPADDNVLDKVQARHQQMIQSLGEEHFIARRFKAEAGGVAELISLNAYYNETFPLGTSIDQEAHALEAVGISQILVSEGRLIELAIHLPIQQGESQEALIARARSACDTWRDSLVVHPPDPWEPPLPDATDGYTWWLCPQTKTALRKPDGWHTKATVQNGVFGYFISKEDVEEKGEYVTGLMVNVTPRADLRYSISAPDIARAIIQSASDAGEVLDKPWRIENGQFIAYGVLTKHKDPQRGDYVTHHLVIGNAETGTLYNTVFEAPADQWEQAWKIGEPIIKLLIISPDI